LEGFHAILFWSEIIIRVEKTNLWRPLEPFCDSTPLEEPHLPISISISVERYVTKIVLGGQCREMEIDQSYCHSGKTKG
jgi:hypothetical protein